jgi:hypothetical protein
MEPPDLVAPSDTREALGVQFGVKLHFVLWGAACMLWAQPEHLAFAVLEAEDVESALQYVGALVPDTWTCELLPVWNLPSQLRLIRQVQRAPTMLLGDVLPQAESNTVPPLEQPQTMPAPTSPEPDEDEEEQEEPSAPTPSSDHQTWPQADGDVDAPGTITQLLEDLEGPQDEAEHVEADGGGEGPQPAAQDQPAEWATQIEQFSIPPVSQARAWLVATSGPSKGRTFPIPIDGATVGRLPENTIYIPDERLSREHARIEFREGRFFLNDLGSRNGTALNGSLVSNPQPLHGGDTIELGSNTLIVGMEGGAQDGEDGE